MITYEVALLIGGIIILIFSAIGLLKKTDKSKIITGCLFIIYLTVVASITLFPIIYEEKVEYFGEITWYNFIPFKIITDMFNYGFSVTALVQIFGNICMSVPYGIFIMMFTKKKKWWKSLFFAVLFTLSIELLQLFIGLSINNMYRNIDIDDIILNVLGCYIGYLVYKLLPYNIKNFSFKT